SLRMHRTDARNRSRGLVISMAIAKERALWQKTKIILAKSYAWQNAPEKTPISGNSIRRSSNKCGRKTAKPRWLPPRHRRCSRPLLTVKTSTVEEKGELQS